MYDACRKHLKFEKVDYSQVLGKLFVNGRIYRVAMQGFSVAKTVTLQATMLCWT